MADPPQGVDEEAFRAVKGSFSITVGFGAAAGGAFPYAPLYEAGASRHPGRGTHAAGRVAARPAARPARPHPALGSDRPAVARRGRPPQGTEAAPRPPAQPPGSA